MTTSTADTVTRPELNAEPRGQLLEGRARHAPYAVAIIAVMMIAEIVTGWLTGSMALLADGLCMATLAVTVGFSGLARDSRPRHRRSRQVPFGNGKVGHLVGSVGALAVAMIAVGIAARSAQLLLVPGSIAYVQATLVAVLGLVVNLVSARLLRDGGNRGAAIETTPDVVRISREAHRDRQDKGSQASRLHAPIGARTSVLAIAALVVGSHFDRGEVDAAIGIVLAIVISHWSWRLLRSKGEAVDGAAGRASGQAIEGRAAKAAALGIADGIDWAEFAPHDRRHRDPALPRLRIAITYLWRHGRLPDLATPARFTELVQASKLRDRDLRMPRLADKVAVKDFVGRVLGEEWVIPTLWHGNVLPAAPEWPTPFVVKSRHGCNQIAFVRTAPESWGAIRRRARRWMNATYGLWLDEWLYRRIPHGVMVEPFVGVGGVLPTDYKLYVFGGRVEAVQVHLDREHAHRWVLFDRNWDRMSSPSRSNGPAPPLELAAMIAAAEKLAQGLAFVRIDMYEIGGRPLFSEMTFYPGSGLDRFDPPTLDAVLGRRWLDAIRSRNALNVARADKNAR